MLIVLLSGISTCLAQKNVSKVSLITSYDFHGKYYKPFAIQAVYELNPWNSQKFNLQCGLGYSQNNYHHIYEGYPGFPACYYYVSPNPKPDVTTSNWCWAETINSNTRNSSISLGGNYNKRFGKKFEIKCCLSVVAEYLLYYKNTTVFFYLASPPAPLELTQEHQYDGKGRPSNLGYQPEIWINYILSPRIKLLLRMHYYQEFEDAFSWIADYSSVGIGITYTFKSHE